MTEHAPGHHHHHKEHHAHEEKQYHGGGGPLYAEGESPRLPRYPFVRGLASPSAYYPKGWVLRDDSSHTPHAPKEEWETTSPLSPHPVLLITIFVVFVAGCAVLIKLLAG